MMELIFLLLLLLFGAWYFFGVKEENGYIYTRFPFGHKNSWGSLPNPKDIKRGYRWTKISRLKKDFKKNKKNKVFIDNFRFDEEYIYKSKMNYFSKRTAEKTAIHFDPISMREGLLIIGKMGSGKTEMYNSILAQDFYSRAVIHQVKAGDFFSKFYKRGDILFSPYDKRGYLWNVLNEDEGILKTFFENFANSIMGDKKDYFSSTSNRLYNELAQKIKTSYKSASNSEKWLLFIKSIKDLFAEMEDGTQNSRKDVKGTMESIIEPLEIMAWQMQNQDQKQFIIKDFFKKKNQCKLFLDNIPEHEKSLTPLFAAFTACLSQVHTSLPDSKTDFTLYALDEYLSLANIMDEPSKKRLHTLIRSKGGIMIPGIQYIPKNDKKMQQLLTSSAYAWLIFSGIDDETIDLIKKTVGEVEYYYQEKNISYNGSKKNKSYSTKNSKDVVIYSELINGLGEKYDHITFLPNHKYIYKGYTPQTELKTRAKLQVPADLTPFYEMKYANDKPKEDIKNLTFKDLFKDKPLSKVDEYSLFKKFLNARKQGEEMIKNFKKEHKLMQVNLELLFQKYLPNDRILESKMKAYSIKERFKLFGEWNKIEGDTEKELEFIEKYQLFGALPNFFDFEDIEY